MKKSLLLLSSIIIFYQKCYADFSDHGHKSEQKEVNQVLVVTDYGIQPETLDLSPSGSSVFILNKSKKPFTLEIDFGKKKANCASKEIEISSDGIMKTKQALKPSEFISICFPDKGIHKVKANNLNAKINVL